MKKKRADWYIRVFAAWLDLRGLMGLGGDTHLVRRCEWAVGGCERNRIPPPPNWNLRITMSTSHLVLHEWGLCRRRLSCALSRFMPVFMNFSDSSLPWLVLFPSSWPLSVLPHLSLNQQVFLHVFLMCSLLHLKTEAIKSLVPGVIVVFSVGGNTHAQDNTTPTVRVSSTTPYVSVPASSHTSIYLSPPAPAPPLGKPYFIPEHLFIHPSQ